MKMVSPLSYYDAAIVAIIVRAVVAGMVTCSEMRNRQTEAKHCNM